MRKSRVIYFTKRPDGMVSQEHFLTKEEPVKPIEAGEVLVETIYLSVDPYMRGRMSDRKSYTEPFPVNTPMQGAAVGVVVDSASQKFSPGEWVFGIWPWAEYVVRSESQIRALDSSLEPKAALHVLGLAGLTAYIGLVKLGYPRPKERLVVSAAAGGVGSLVGQIGKLTDLHVTGIAGSDEKCAWLTSELGFDQAINYRSPSFLQHITQSLDDGVDIYFDNVGGVVTDTIMSHLNPHARIVVCGQIATYNVPYASQRPLFADLLTSRAQARGFIVGEHQEHYPEALKALSQWYEAGQLKVAETIVLGFDHLVEAFIGLFEGKNMGKTIVQIK